MKKYSVKELSKLAGISVRTLHHYDKIGLLKPAIRTEARYRLYGHNELLKLQQILFYKELGFTLGDIMDILNDPRFDLPQALENHKQALLKKQKRLSQMLDTIEKTKFNLKKRKMITDEELYEGFPKKSTQEIRNDVSKTFGKRALETSETYLKTLTKEQFQKLKTDYQNIFENLFDLSNKDPESEAVQLEVARHFTATMKFWGTYGSGTSQKKKYIGLGELYVQDERFTMMEGKAQPEFARFLSKAMTYYADIQLD